MPDVSRLDFLHPSKTCDVVMKGGITSGIVYPSTVCRLAEIYRFVNIGGTSAGAIAAAATAAAEYRRAPGSGEGFEKLSRLPAFLAAKPNGSKHTNLFRLFQPDPAVHILFDLGVSFTRKGGRQWISVLGALLKGAWLVWLLFAILATLYILLPSLFDATRVAFRPPFFSTVAHRRSHGRFGRGVDLETQSPPPERIWLVLGHDAEALLPSCAHGMVPRVRKRNCRQTARRAVDLWRSKHTRYPAPNDLHLPYSPPAIRSAIRLCAILFQT